MAKAVGGKSSTALTSDVRNWSIDDLQSRTQMRPLTLIDEVQQIHLALWAAADGKESPNYKDYFFAITRFEAVTGKITFDEFIAAGMIKNFAVLHSDRFPLTAAEHENEIWKAMRRAVGPRRCNMSRDILAAMRKAELEAQAAAIQ